MSLESKGLGVATPEVFEVSQEIIDEMQPIIKHYLGKAESAPMLDRYVAYTLSVCDFDEPNMRTLVSEQAVLTHLEMVKAIDEEDLKLVAEAVDVVWDYVRTIAQDLGLDQ